MIFGFFQSFANAPTRPQSVAHHTPKNILCSLTSPIWPWCTAHHLPVDAVHSGADVHSPTPERRTKPQRFSVDQIRTSGPYVSWINHENGNSEGGTMLLIFVVESAAPYQMMTPQKGSRDRYTFAIKSEIPRRKNVCQTQETVTNNQLGFLV